MGDVGEYDVGEYIDGVTRWHHSPQRHRWMALAVLEAENGFRRLDSYEDLPRLQAARKRRFPTTNDIERKNPFSSFQLNLRFRPLAWRTVS